MFSSNQTLDISGDLSHDGDLRDAIDFAIRKSEWYGPFTREENRLRPTFQINEYGGYFIGWNKGQKNSWSELPFDYDPDILSRIIAQHLKGCDMPRSSLWDGEYSNGFLIKSMNDCGEGIKEPQYGIIAVYPYPCFYAK